MTGQELLEALDDILTFGHEPTDEQRKAISFVLDILAEIHQYRAIGTVEEIRRMQKYFALAKKHGTISKVIETCAEYEEIGTVEECWEAREKQKAKKPIEFSPCRSVSYYKCPDCGDILNIGKDFCCNCGQRLDWREDEVLDSR